MSEPALPSPQLIRRRTIAPIWLLPIVALLVGVWLIWRSLLDTGPVITVAFDSGEGIVVNQTTVQHKGIAVGTVRSMSANKDFTGVDVGIELSKSLAATFDDGLPADTSFWLVTPQVSLAGVSGLGTLLSGNYIGMALPAERGANASHFTALKHPPGLSTSVPGLHIQLTTDKRGSVAVGTPILSRQMPIGNVTTVGLAEDGTGVQIGVHILPEYSYLVRKNTRFWNASGLRLEAGLGGLRVETDSLQSLLNGGISISLPDLDDELSKNGDQFMLYEDFAAAENSVIAFIEFPSAQGLTQGATKVIYKGLPVGKLLSLTYNNKTDTVTGRFGIDPRFDQFITDQTRFWLVRPQLSAAGITGLDALVSGAYVTFYTAGGKPVSNHLYQAAQGPDPNDYSDLGLHLKLKVIGAKSVNEGAPVYYNDFVVGSVKSRTLDGTHTLLHILIDEQYRYLINKSTRFWNISGVNFSADVQKGVSLKTGPVASVLVGGVAFYTPSSKAPSVSNGYAFELAPDEEAVLQNRGSRFGLQLQLQADDAAGLSVGAPILYRELPIGRIQAIAHAPDGAGVNVNIQIEREHKELIGSNTRFYRSSPLEMSVGAGGVNLRTGPLAQWLSGGIALDQFGKAQGAAAANGERFRLYSNRDAAEMAGLSIRLRLNDAEGLSIGSELRYQGLVIGEITRLRFTDNLQAVEAEAALRPDSERLLTENSQFWKVEAKLGLARTENLGTLLGSYLQLYPAPGKPARSFTVQARKPVARASKQGLNLTLVAERLGSLKAGDPVLYRQVNVGEVLGSELTEQGDKVQIYINIWPEHQQLVKTASRFWTASGVRIKAGLFSGVDIAAESLETIVSGGINFATPQVSSAPASSNMRFTLLTEEPDWDKLQPAKKARFSSQQQREIE